MRKYLSSFVFVSILLAVQPVAAATESFIYRYKGSLVSPAQGPTNPGPVDPTDPGPVDPIEPTDLVCGDDDPNSSFTCVPGADEPSKSGRDPILISLMEPPASPTWEVVRGVHDDHGYRCFSVSGGSGNYVFGVESDAPYWVKTVDIVPASDLAAAADIGTSWFQYPGYDGDWDIISPTNEVCVRIIVEKDASDGDDNLDVSLTVVDYLDEDVVNGRANYIDPGIDAAKEVFVTFNSAAFVSVDEDTEEDPGANVQLDETPLPSGADVAARDYRCVRATGGEGNYSFYVSMDVSQPWMKTIDIVAASDPNAAVSNTWAFYIFPKGDFISPTNEICVRVIPKTGVPKTGDVTFTLAAFDYNDGDVVDGKVSPDANASGYGDIELTVNGD